MMADSKNQLRRGIIMGGYRDDDPGGDVLTEHGELLGSWHMDTEEWCHFAPEDTGDKAFSAPSPWMLHNVIADWYETSNKGAK